MLSAVSGGMYEIGDDLPMLGAEKDRLALVENQDLLRIAKVSRAFTPVDLLSYESEDEQPSIFFLKQEQRQSMLAVFNWTEKPRSHTLTLAALGLPASHTFQGFDVLNQNESFGIEGGAVRLANQPPHSVRMIKLIDSAVPAAAPTVTAQVPAEAKAGDSIKLSAQAQATGVPALSFRWDFGDGTTADGSVATHTYTRSADFTVKLTVDGLDGMVAEQTFPVKVTGTVGLPPGSRRLVESSDH
jgi:hypothetical protein